MLSVDAIYIDFSHAFDGVVHSKLIHKLTGFGISGLLLRWIESFLSNRFQRVVLEHCFSEWGPVISGVPQGSVLEPILFILFIDDVALICSGTISHHLFADDLKLYSTLQSASDAFCLQEAINRLEHWCTLWQLEVNVSKCHVLHIGKDNVKTIYYFSGVIIPSTTEASDLGVTVEKFLTFDSHINNIIKKAYCRVGALFKGFSSLLPTFLGKAFITYVRPILEYASNVWSPYLLKHVNALENVQRRFTKRIPSLRHLSYSERLIVLALEPLELRRLKADLTLYFKIFNNFVHIPRSYLPPSSNPTNTRSGGGKLALAAPSTNNLDNNFFTRVVPCWNFLPDSVLSAPSVYSFKNKLCTVDLRSFLRCNFY
jgi:hypothetical protein